MKAQMRREMRALLNRMPDAENVMRSGQACERICALPEYIDATLVLCYLSFGKELVSDFLCAHALANGKILSAPRVTPGGHLEVCTIRDMHPEARSSALVSSKRGSLRARSSSERNHWSTASVLPWVWARRVQRRASRWPR